MSNAIRRVERGDTIIEVLISITIIGLTFGIGFNIANSGLQTGRAATERGEALKLAETQIELLKASLSDDTPEDFKISEPYCVLELNKTEENPVTEAGSNCNGLNGTFYNLQLEYTEPTTSTPASPASYRSSVLWELPNSQDGRVDIYYRPYDEQ